MTPEDTHTAAIARRCVETRRVMKGAWESEQFGRTFALDLMGIPPDQLAARHVEYADLVRQTSAESLAEAMLFVADHDMTALVDTAAPTMPDQVLREDDMLAPHGWLWFAEPLPDRTGVGATAAFKAVQWALLGPDHPLLERSRGARRPLGDAAAPAPAVLIQPYSDTLEYARAVYALEDRPGDVDGLMPGAPGLMPSASVIWVVGSHIGTAYGRSVEDLAADGGLPVGENDPGFYQRALAAFWTLARQPLTATTERQPARPDRRRSARAGVRDADAPVRVLRLRGNSGSGKDYGAGTGRTVSVRFAVRGHWRNQWLPSTKSHRQQWIAPYLKGPETGPLRGGERVFLAEGDGAALPEPPEKG